MNPTVSENPQPRAWSLAPRLLAAAATALFCLRVYHGLRFNAFVDESEHLLGGKMLNAGAVLYRDFVSQHGPVTFMLTQAYGALLGWDHANRARLVPAALALGAAACLRDSLSLRQAQGRDWALALFLGLISGVWLVQALYLVSYHTIGGCCLVAALGLFVVPLWLGQRPGAARAAGAGACLVLMAATAYSFAPTVFLLGISALWAAWRGRHFTIMRPFLGGGLAAGFFVLIWLLLFGSLPGYLAFHFAENQFVFSHYNGMSWSYFWHSIIPVWTKDARVQALGLTCWSIALPCLLLLDRRRAPAAPAMAGPILLGGVALMALNARGGTGFSNGSFLLGSMALASIGLAGVLECWALPHRHRRVLLASLLVGACVVVSEISDRRALYSPLGITRAQAMAQPWSTLGRSEDPTSQRLRQLTQPHETILAVPYAPYIYMRADRPPMRRYFYYLPWDAAYAGHPYFGQTHNICADLPKHPPAVIYFDHWVVWDRWDMRGYMPCFFTYMNAHYTQDPSNPNLHIRNDRIPPPTLKP